MAEPRQILFIQGGGGHDVHDEWDDKLVDSLRRELGDGYDVRYPRMPDEDNPSFAKWAPAIRGEMTRLGDSRLRHPGRDPGSACPSRGSREGGSRLGGRDDEKREWPILIGHSIGGTMLVQALADSSAPPPQQEGFQLGAIVLISAPFVGEGGWPGDEFELPGDLGAKLPQGVPVHIFHGSEDRNVPPAHADLYARAVPQAKVHRLPGRDHQLNNDLGEVAEAAKAANG